jgi:hypothetical protein
VASCSQYLISRNISQSIDNETLELILCKISSAVCETERISENFTELKKRYLKVLRELSVANEVNNMLKRKIGNLQCREAALMGHLRQNTELFGEDEINNIIIN